ncbi:hypothetical protein niasHS_010683 [Heterodera schachtii]|uniref:Ubiquitin-like domain-containing protein n=1 Tax=Heterodera schachtii TaxID=97005 RepID=A0ABD2IU83_HETSC
MSLIKLVVKTIDGKDSIVRVDPKMSLDHLRHAIEAATGISKNDQRLIFRGRILKDESLSLTDQGFDDGLAIHVVTKPPPASTNGSSTESRSSETSQSHQQPEVTVVPQITTQNLIVGQVVLERTSLFDDPNVALDAVTNALEEIRGAFQLETESSLNTNIQNGSFAVNVILRGMREQIVDGPARERFESLRVEVKKLAWLVALVKAQFVNRIDAIFSSQDELSQPEAYQTIGDILLAMHSFDHFDENDLKRFTERDEDQELITLIRELTAWQLPDDEAHLQTLNRNTVVRHCLSMDLSRLLVFLGLVDAKINEHLMSRFNLVLSHRHNLQSSSYSARLMNCFSSAVSRIQHARAHIYHSISDIGVHVDDNGFNRLFPQLLHYERATEPPQADITLTFVRPGATPSHSQMPSVVSQQPPSRDSPPHSDSTPNPPSHSQQNNPTALNSLLSGFMSFAHQLLGGVPDQNHPRRPTISPRTSRSVSFAPRSSASSRSTNSAGLTGQFPRPFRHVQGSQRRFPFGLTTLNWNQTPPSAPNALFVGPRPPFVFPIFTIDPFLTCSSRRYRVFESDSRHNDFWNDPETARLGIFPPSNSVTASSNRMQNVPPFAFNSASDDILLDGMSHNQRGNANANMGPPQGVGSGSSAENSDSSADNQPSNEQGEAAFNSIGDFSHFVRQIFHSVVHGMAVNDSSIFPPNSAQARNGFTANSRVTGFTPLIVNPSLSRESDELFMNIGAVQGLIAMPIPPRGNAPQNQHHP